MPDNDRLTVAEAAALADVQPNTWNAYVSRGQAPPADGQLDGRTPYWRRATVLNWIKSRPGPGSRTDLHHAGAKRDDRRRR